MSARHYASVFADGHFWHCVFDQRLGFMCGRCKKLLGHTPKVGECCGKCGAQVEEVVYPTKRVDAPRIAGEAKGAERGALRRVSNARGDRNQ